MMRRTKKPINKLNHTLILALLHAQDAHADALTLQHLLQLLVEDAAPSESVKAFCETQRLQYWLNLGSAL